jgi:predicted O-methyltransferase YrrM
LAQRVRQVIERLFGDGTAVARSSGQTHTLFPAAIGQEEGEALRECVRREHATRTIEIGLGYGISALFICEGLLWNGEPDARHVAIDPHQSTRFDDCALQFLEDAGVTSMVQHVSEESQIVLPRLLADRRTFDLAFVDGNHRFDAVFIDLVYLGRLLHPATVIFLDDYQLPAVARAVRFFLTNLGWRVEEVSSADPHHQWAVVRTSREPDTRAFDYFVEF